MSTSRVIHVISEFEGALQKKLTAMAPSASETAAREFGVVVPNKTVDTSREVMRNRWIFTILALLFNHQLALWAMVRHNFVSQNVATLNTLLNFDGLFCSL